MDEAIKKLEISNKGIDQILGNLHEQLSDLRADTRIDNELVDDLENLFFAYLKTWKQSNSDIIEILKSS